MPHLNHRAPHVGNNVYDRAAIRLHRVAVNLARHIKPARQIGGYDSIPAISADVLEPCWELATRIVD